MHLTIKRPFFKIIYSFSKTTVMKTEAILKADVLDIIFENKNKLYGAYTLRKFYNNRMYKALGIMCGMVAVLCLCSFMVKEKEVFITKDYPTGTEFVKPPADVKKVEPPKVEAPSKAPALKPPTQSYTTNIVIKQNPTNVPPIKDLVDGVQIDVTNTKGKVGSDPIITSPLDNGPDTSSGKGKEPVASVIDKFTPMPEAEVMPTFSGGMQALRNFLQKNLQNPQDLEENEIKSVKIRFVVGYDGKLKGFETVEDGGDAFNREVIRVLKKMPEWIPGKTKGESVSVYYTIPVKFTSTSD
jgi:periplasmic protein TonB